MHKGLVMGVSGHDCARGFIDIRRSEMVPESLYILEFILDE